MFFVILDIVFVLPSPSATSISVILITALVAFKVYKRIKRKRQNPFVNEGGDE